MLSRRAFLAGVLATACGDDVEIGLGIGLGFARKRGAVSPPEPADSHLQIDTFFATGTYAAPADRWGPTDGVYGSVLRLSLGGGAGGTTAVGAGGGGASAATEDVIADGNHTVAVATAVAANTNGEDTAFDSNPIAKGGLSGANGGTGGTAAASTGTTKYGGGDGTLGAGTTTGGAGAGDLGAASGGTPGEVLGGPGTDFASPIGAGGNSTAAAQRPGSRGELRCYTRVPRTAGMPRLISEVLYRDTANGTTRNITLPSGSGGQLRVIVASDGTPTITMGGDWTALVQINGTGVSMRLFWQPATGSESVAVATDASEMCAIIVQRWEDAGEPQWATASGSSTNADAPLGSHTDGAGDYMVQAIAALDADAKPLFSGIPANFGNFTWVPARSTTGVSLGQCSRFYTDPDGSGLNPAAFTTSNEQWVSATVFTPFLA